MLNRKKQSQLSLLFSLISNHYIQAKLILEDSLQLILEDSLNLLTNHHIQAKLIFEDSLHLM